MDHTAVVRQKMTERYLLDELDAEIRDEFEEHFFDCPACALDVRAEVEVVAHSKTILAESPEPVLGRAAAGPERVRREWFAWLRPAFAAPALALLLFVTGYQNLVTVPGLRSDATHALVLPTVSVNVGTYGMGGTATAVPEGKGLIVVVRIPQDGNYARYTAELFGPGGKLEGSFGVPATAGQDQWSVTFPTAHREAGTYSVAVHGFTAGGEEKDLPSKSFELQIQR